MTTIRLRPSSAARGFASLLTNVALAVADAIRADVKEEETFETSVDLDAGGEVIAVAYNGSIQVETWEGTEVRIEARKGARGHDEAEARELLEQTEVRIEERGNSVRISAETPRSRGLEGHLVTVSFKLLIPSDAQLDARTKNGAITVRGLSTRTRLETKNGAITARGVTGPLELESRNGSVKALDAKGSVRARTSNGSIRVAIDGNDLGEGVRLETRNGSIGLRLDSDVAASISARSRHSSVTSQIEGEVRKRTRRSLALDMNGGGPWIDLESSSGRIRIVERERPSES